MTQMPVCQGKIVSIPAGPSSPFQCWNESTTPGSGAPDGIWIFVTPPPSDLSWLESAFTFDLLLFSELMGFCVLLFVIGHSTGHVARTLGRV